MSNDNNINIEHLEDDVSLKLYNERVPNANQYQRLLKKKKDSDNNNNNNNNNGSNNIIPQPQSAKKTQHGIMIDAGSQGTRIHVYEFHSRILQSKKDIEQTIHGQKLSFPTTDTRWTNRLKPGVS